MRKCDKSGTKKWHELPLLESAPVTAHSAKTLVSHIAPRQAWVRKARCVECDSENSRDETRFATRVSASAAPQLLYLRAATAKWIFPQEKPTLCSRAGCKNSRSRLKNVPQGLKPQDLCGSCGTTEVVPFHGAVYATGSGVVSLKFVEEQPQVLRLRLPQKARQTSLRMTILW
jgi:hypothetical protein